MVKLHIGCGARVLRDWVNIDLAYDSNETHRRAYGDEPSSLGGMEDFIAIDVVKEPLPFPDGSVDVIFHEDFLEHLDQRSQILFLAETLRVLKPGGGHRVNTPSLLQMRRHSDFSKGLRGVCVSPEWDRWHHKNVLTPLSLEELALMVGYSSIIFNGRDQSVFAEHLPHEYRPGPDRCEDENIFADLIK